MSTACQKKDVQTSIYTLAIVSQIKNVMHHYAAVAPKHDCVKAERWASTRQLALIDAFVYIKYVWGGGDAER